MTRQQYDKHHVAERKRHKPTVDAGQAHCNEIICLIEQDGGSRWIKPGTKWHLAHDRTRPGQYLGPAHARCNSGEGGRFQTVEKPPEFWPVGGG